MTKQYKQTIKIMKTNEKKLVYADNGEGGAFDNILSDALIMVHGRLALRLDGLPLQTEWQTASCTSDP